MLLKIHEYLRRERIASDQQIAREFGLDLQALEPMLLRWLNKGIISCYQAQTTCQSACFKCKQPPLYYQFIPLANEVTGL